MLIPKKYHIHVIAMIAVAAIVLYPFISNKIDPEMLKGASAAAEEFLALVDAEDYAAARNTAANLLRDKVAPEVWHRQIGVMRDKVGAVQARKQDKVFHSTYASDAPDGEYITIEYRTDFANKKQALETVNLMLEKGTTWRVVGYFIK